MLGIFWILWQAFSKVHILNMLLGFSPEVSLKQLDLKKYADVFYKNYNLFLIQSVNEIHILIYIHTYYLKTKYIHINYIIDNSKTPKFFGPKLSD